jgi:hypothetical protein
VSADGIPGDPDRIIHNGIVMCRIMGGSAGGAYTASIQLQRANPQMSQQQAYQFCVDAAKYLCTSLSPQEIQNG